MKPDPKKTKERFFIGRVWVEDQDLQIVKTKGKGVPETKINKFPIVETYREQIDVPFDKWSRPDVGFLGGTVENVDATKSLRLKDFHDKEWLVDISGAVITLDNAIEDEGDIAIRGVRTGPLEFRAETIAEFD